VVVHADRDLYLLSVGAQRFGRVGYRGTYQSDIWQLEPGQQPERITDRPGYDTDPMFGADGVIYWRGEGDQTGAFNVWRRDADGATTRLTDFREEGIRNARISADGARIVCEAGDGLWILETATGELRELPVTIAADVVGDPQEFTTVRGDADELAVASGGDELALVVKGELVLVNRELEGRATVALPSPWRESGIHFRPGSADTLVFVSDRARDDGVPYSRIGLLLSDDPETSLLRDARAHRIEWLTPEGVESFDPQWSPDGERIAYRHGHAALAVMDADGDDREILYEGWDAPRFSWSPDSRWLAYAAATGPAFNTDVWLVPADGGEAVNVSQHPDYDYGPVWNESGSMLAWTSRRFGNQSDVVFCYLTRADDERSEEQWKIWEKTRDDAPDDGEADAGAGEDGEDGEEVAEKEAITIDLEDIHLRVRRLTNLPGDESVVAIHPQGDRIAFGATVGGERDLYTVDRFGEDLEPLTRGGTGSEAARLGPDGKQVWLLAKGRPAHVALAGGDLESVSFRARLEIDRQGLRRQVVEEAYRMLRDQFYDPDMHGIDWDAQREKALELAAAVDHDDDFADVMNIMLRRLNASHMGYYPGGRGGRGGAGWLGVEFDREHDGEGVRLAAVIPHGPADRAGEDGLEAGDVILSIDDQPVGDGANFYAPLAAAGEEPVLVRYERDGEEQLVELRPDSFGSVRQAIYERDVKANRARVEGMTDGEVGYVHIQGMGRREVEVFERDLHAAAAGKDALIIDVRWNGGGWTTDLLLTILTQPTHAYTIPRGGEVGYPDAERLPMQRWNKPIAVICNEASYSNAEIFSHAIKTIDRGPVIGQTTGGNVISTGGWRTLDGGWVRLPFRGWYVWGDDDQLARNNKNQEHGGAIPDHLVPMGPAELLAGEDPQLARAVELMREAAAMARQMPEPDPQPAAAAQD
jgi:tricorn protease